MALTTRTGSVAALALEIDGKHAAFLDGFDGGGAFADVVEAHGPGAPGAPTDKSIGVARYDDIVITCGLPEDTLAAWVSEFLAGKATRHDGAIILLNLNRQPVRRLEWEQGTIHEVAFPPLDATAGKTSAHLTITIRPTLTKDVGGGGSLPGASKSQRKLWIAANFAMSMPGIDCTRVVRVDPLTVTQTYHPPSPGSATPVPGPLHVGDLVVTVQQAGATDFLRWAEDFIVGGKNTASEEKDATIRLLAPNLRDDIATLTVLRTGIFRADHDSHVAGVVRTSQLRLSMYAEDLQLAWAAAPAVAPAASPAAPPTHLDVRPTLGKRLAAVDVAARLREQPTTEPRLDAVASERRLGRDVGFAWAQRHASLTELREVAAAGDLDWSSLSLPEGHSLAGTLAASIDIPLLHDGSLELPRDALSEGVLAGVLEALAELNEQVDV